MSYFRHFLLHNEYSIRGYHLTSLAIQHNSANYTVWNYRRECIEHLNLSLSQELDKLQPLSLESPKNYQLWNHRRRCIEKLGLIHNELSVTVSVSLRILRLHSVNDALSCMLPSRFLLYVRVRC